MRRILTARTLSCARTTAAALMTGTALFTLAPTAFAQSSEANPAAQTARIPDVAQYEMETILRRIGERNLQSGQRLNTFATYIYETPTLGNEDIQSLVKTNSMGGVMGVEGFVSGNIYAGAAISYIDSEMDTNDIRLYDSEQKAIHGYGGIQLGELDLRAGGSYGWIDINNITRSTGVDTADAIGETKGDYYDLFVRAGGSTEFQGAEIEGSVAFHASKIDIDTFSEVAANPLALRFEEQSRKSRRIEADLAVRPFEVDIASGIVVKPVIDANYRHEFSDGDFALASQLIDNSAPLSSLTSAGAASDRLTGGIGLDMIIRDVWTVGARYEKTWAKDVSGADALSVSVSRSF